MTPEERADGLRDAYYRGPSDLHDRVIAAIREAEDDALERAAKVADDLAYVEDGDLVGDIIRALKSKRE